MIRVIQYSVWSVDSYICRKVASYTGKRFIDRFMVLLSRSADGPLYGLVILLVLAIDRNAVIPFLIATVTAFAFEIFAQKAIKYSFKRKRPGESVSGVRFLMNPPDKFSFPSGHTAGAVIIAMMVSFYFGIPVIPLIIWACLVALSRIYNGVHFPTDVIFGAILGFVSAQGSLLVLV